MTELRHYLKLVENKPSAGQNVTIADATKSNGGIDRRKADRMLDPHNYFGKNKRRIKTPK
jgi:hypothetical protein